MSADGDEKALLDLAIEQLCGQMNSALQVATDFPREYPDLFFVGASMARREDVVEVTDLKRARFAQENGATPEERTQHADARNRVTHQLQRAVDAFQIATSFRWKWLMQMASFIVSGTLAFTAIAMSSTTHAGTNIVAITIAALLAGFFAPVARDLTAVLQKLRGG